MPSRIVRTPGAAEYVGLRPGTLEKFRLTGGGPRFIRVGSRAVAYDLEDLDAWLTSRKVASTSEPTSGRAQP